MTNKQIKIWIKEAHENAIQKGFYSCYECVSMIGQTVIPVCKTCNGTGINPNKNIGELLMLIVSELSEALEAHRCGRFAQLDNYLKDEKLHGFDKTSYEYFVKGTFCEEIADVFIRLFDLCGYLEIEPVISQDLDRKDVPENVGEALLILVDQVINYRYSGYQNWAETMICTLESFCQKYNIPIEKHIEAKMAYNKTRPKLHGKKY